MLLAHQAEADPEVDPYQPAQAAEAAFRALLPDQARVRAQALGPAQHRARDPYHDQAPAAAADPSTVIIVANVAVRRAGFE